MTQKLLGFARKGKYVDRELQIDELIQESIEIFMPASQRNIDLEFTNNLTESKIKGDKVQLQQVFLNIMINASDAMENIPDEKMGIKVILDEGEKYKSHCRTTEKEQITANNFYCVVIKDTGEGIEKDLLNQIFDPFFTTKPTGKGTGMGLAMVYGTVTNHGGLINVTSKKGEGTTFYIFLPKLK